MDVDPEIDAFAPASVKPPTSAPLINNLHMAHVWDDTKEGRPITCLRCGAVYPDSVSCP